MWFIIALLIGAGIASLAFWLRSRNITVTWYEWLIGIVGFLLLIFAIQNFFGSFAEDEASAAPMFLLLLGLPSLILLGVAWQLVRRKNQSTG